MKTIQWIKRPIGIVVLTVFVTCSSLLIVRSDTPPQASPILTVVHAQQVAAIKSAPRGNLLLFPYANRIGQIDASACPDDFFQAWQKYVADVQTLAAIRRANIGNVVVYTGVALITKDPNALLGAIPKNTAEAEISLNSAVADWQNVKHVALRYGIKITPPKFDKRHGVWRSA